MATHTLRQSTRHSTSVTDPLDEHFQISQKTKEIEHANKMLLEKIEEARHTIAQLKAERSVLYEYVTKHSASSLSLTASMPIDYEAPPAKKEEDVTTMLMSNPAGVLALNAHPSGRAAEEAFNAVGSTSTSTSTSVTAPTPTPAPAVSSGISSQGTAKSTFGTAFNGTGTTSQGTRASTTLTPHHLPEFSPLRNIQLSNERNKEAGTATTSMSPSPSGFYAGTRFQSPSSQGVTLPPLQPEAGLVGPSNLPSLSRISTTHLGPDIEGPKFILSGSQAQAKTPTQAQPSGSPQSFGVVTDNLMASLRQAHPGLSEQELHTLFLSKSRALYH